MAVPAPLTRQELYKRVWAEPLRTIAKEYGLSDVGLKKLCRRHDIPTPGLGYWAKVEFGKRVSRTPLLQPETRPRIRCWRSTETHLLRPHPRLGGSRDG